MCWDSKCHLWRYNIISILVVFLSWFLKLWFLGLLSLDLSLIWCFGFEMEGNELFVLLKFCCGIAFIVFFVKDSVWVSDIVSGYGLWDDCGKFFFFMFLFDFVYFFSLKKKNPVFIWIFLKIFLLRVSWWLVLELGLRRWSSIYFRW